MNMALPGLVHDIEWRHARTWVGRQLVLKKPWLKFAAGTPCRVMCVVDFGDGPLFWITTDDAETIDIDQVTRRELETHFGVLDGGAYRGRGARGMAVRTARASLPGAGGKAS